MPTPSITGAIQPALEHMQRVLFQPFSWRKWFVLGFCAFLAQLGGGGTFNYRWNQSAWHGSPVSDAVREWVLAHLPLVVFLAALLVVFMLVLTGLFLWIGSRGTFLFLEGVARNRAEVVEPWRRFRYLGNQLFRFRLMLTLAFLGLLGLCLALGVFVAVSLHRSGPAGAHLIAALVGMGAVLLLGLLAFVAASLLLKDFIVPIMYRRELGVWDAWSVFRQELLPGRAWSFVGFYLMALLLAFPALLLALAVICLTCCVAILPYLSSVALLPIFVFFRAYSLCFLEQFGEDWRILESPASDPLPGPS